MCKLRAGIAGVIALVAFGTGCTRNVSYKADIVPIFQERCMVCHAEGAPGCLASGFSLATYESLMRGTKFGPMVVAGQGSSSNLLVLVKHQADPSIAMPRSQTSGKPSGWLLPEQINLIETWINQGAKNN